MKTAGIVAEYNPFHNGHAHHIEETRQLGATHIVVVMGGHFMQRGEPAIATKWSRANAALSCGADLVVQLPLPWAMGTAETFAAGAVNILSALGAVDTLSFGSESGDISLLKSAAKAVLSPEIKEPLKSHLQKGIAFPLARQKAVSDIFGKEAASVLSTPNNILAVEYLKAIISQNSTLEPVTISRKGAGYHSLTAVEGIPSATMLRRVIKAKRGRLSPYMPRPAFEILKEEIKEKRAPALLEKIEPAILSHLRRLDIEDLATLPDISEGLEHRLYSAIRSTSTLKEIYDAVKTKRYAHSRIRRLVMSAYLGIRKEDLSGPPPYIWVIGMNQRGREILKKAKETATLPIVSSASQIAELDNRAKRIFALECRATDLFALSTPKPLPCGLEMTTPIIKL